MFTKDPIKESLIEMDTKLSKKAAQIFICIIYCCYFTAPYTLLIPPRASYAGAYTFSNMK